MKKSTSPKKHEFHFVVEEYGKGEYQYIPSPKGSRLSFFLSTEEELGGGKFSPTKDVVIINGNKEGLLYLAKRLIHMALIGTIQ